MAHSLDALIAAPEFHRLLLENDDVRVLETRSARGDSARAHALLAERATTLAAHFVRRDGEGNVLGDTRAADLSRGRNMRLARAMPPHSVENVGSTDIRLLTVELKRG